MQVTLILFAMVSIFLTLIGMLFWTMDRATYLAFKEGGTGEIPPTLFKFSD
jgi:hypothetical protein